MLDYFLTGLGCQVTIRDSGKSLIPATLLPLVFVRIKQTRFNELIKTLGAGGWNLLLLVRARLVVSLVSGLYAS